MSPAGFTEDEPTEPNEVAAVADVTPLPSPASDLRPFYGIIITFGVMNDRENARVLGLPKHVHSLPALAWHTIKCVWKYRNLLRGRPG